MGPSDTNESVYVSCRFTAELHNAGTRGTFWPEATFHSSTEE